MLVPLSRINSPEPKSHMALLPVEQEVIERYWSRKVVMFCLADGEFPNFTPCHCFVLGFLVLGTGCWVLLIWGNLESSFGFE